MGLQDATGGVLPTVAQLTPSGDTSGARDAANLQAAINAAVAADGGEIVLSSGAFYVNAQITLYPNVTLRGQGNGYRPASTYYGTNIVSLYNGSTILITNDSRSSTFPHLRDLTLYGSNSLASQNGIEISNSGGNVLDTILDGVCIFHMGQHGILVGGTAPKLLADNCYIEFCGGNGISWASTQGNLIVTRAFMTGMTGNCIDGSGSGGNSTWTIANCSLSSSAIGIVPPAAAAYWSVADCQITGCASGGIVPAGANATVGALVNGNLFSSNGSSSIAQIVVATANFGSSNFNIVGNTFTDTRAGTSRVTNHIALAASGNTLAQVVGNEFYNSQSDAVAWTSRSGNLLVVADNRGYNDVKGKITTMFSAANRIGAAGSTATATASTDYTAEGTDLYLNVSGGTGVSMTIKDPQGNTISSGLTTFAGPLPVGYKINFGAFSGAPTVVASVI